MLVGCPGGVDWRVYRSSAVSLESIGVEEHHHESARKSRAGLCKHQLNRDDETDAPSTIPKVRVRAAVCCAASFLDSFFLSGSR